MIEVNKFGKILNLFFGWGFDKVIGFRFGDFFVRSLVFTLIFFKAEAFECFPKFLMAGFGIGFIFRKPDSPLLEKELLDFLSLKHGMMEQK